MTRLTTGFLHEGCVLRCQPGGGMRDGRVAAPLSTKLGAGWPCGIGAGQSEGPEPSRLRKLRPYERSRCAEHGGSCEEVTTHHVRGVLCLPTGFNHVCTTRGLTLLISIGISLENTNRSQPESPGPVGEKIRSGRRGVPRPDPKQNRPLRIVMIPSVAGCTTGSLCPRCPYIQDEVLSLYQAEFLSTVRILIVNGP